MTAWSGWFPDMLREPGNNPSSLISFIIQECLGILAARVRVMQLHDILLLRTSAILPEAISARGLTPS